MKRDIRKIICLVLAVLLCLAALSGCGGGSGREEKNDSSSDGTSDTGFSYSGGMDENGYWADIKALDLVDLCDYVGIEVPADVWAISDETLEQELQDRYLSQYMEESQIFDRAVADGDTVNIDFVGSIDGVEFSGGSTGGAGTTVTIGVTSYIDDFLEQLIGHMPGDTFDVEVTFPEDYGKEELNGKDAVFVTTVNYIVEKIPPELTDEFVSASFYESYGWSTAEDMRESLRKELADNELAMFLEDYIVDNSTVKQVPESLIEYQDNLTIAYYSSIAASYGMDLASFLSSYMGFSDSTELLAARADVNYNTAEYYMIVQAIAEEQGIKPTEDDIAAYFQKFHGTTDYSSYQENYGLPYLKMVVLLEKVTDFLAENAVYQ